jgi:hypothetical protein
MDDLPTMMRGGYHGSTLGLDEDGMTFSRHYGPYVVLPCVWICLFGMAPHPIASVTSATVEALVLRLPLTGAASSH